MLKIHNLTTWYEPTNMIIQDASFDIKGHCVMGLLGVNGAGKTTLMNVLSGVHSKYKVQRCFFEEESATFEDKGLKVNRYTVFTEHEGFRYWNFTSYLEFIEKVYDLRRDQKSLDELIKGFCFEAYVNKLICELSTGNKKKVYLIIGFYLKRKLLILDEPFDGLDFTATEYLYTRINEYRAFGTIFMSSHIAESFDRTCDSLLILENGQITQKDFDKGSTLRSQI